MKNFFSAAYRGMTNRTLHTFKGVGMNNFVVTIRKYDLTVTTQSGDFEIKAKVWQRIYFLFRYLAEKKDVDTINNVCTIMYMTINAIAADAGIANKLLDEVRKWTEEMMKKGEKRAADVTEAGDKMAFHEVKANVERGEELASRQQKRKAQRETVKRLQRDAAGRFKRNAESKPAEGTEGKTTEGTGSKPTDGTESKTQTNVNIN